jgi:hypothetical protein
MKRLSLMMFFDQTLLGNGFLNRIFLLLPQDLRNLPYLLFNAPCLLLDLVGNLKYIKVLERGLKLVDAPSLLDAGHDGRARSFRFIHD